MYTDRNVLIRVVLSTGDESYRLELLAKLKDLRSNAALVFAVETHTAVLDVHAELISTHVEVTGIAEGMALMLVSFG